MLKRHAPAIIAILCGIFAALLATSTVFASDAGIDAGSALQDAGSASAPAAPVAAPTPAADASPAPDPESDTGGFLKAIYDAATSGKWKVLAGLVLVGLVFLTRKWIAPRVKWFSTKLGGATLALLLSLGATFGLALASGAALSIGMALSALSTAVTAAGLWQWLQSMTAAKA